MKNPNRLISIRKFCNRLSFSGNFLFFNRIMRNIFKRHTGSICIDDFDKKYSIELSLNEHMQSRIFWMNYYNTSIIRFMSEFLKPGMTVIDIGANIGEITLAAANRVSAQGCVIAFEPISSIYEALIKNITYNKIYWAKAEKLALADKKGISDIYTTLCNEEQDNAGLATLYPTDKRKNKVETIHISTLDNYLMENPIGQIDLVKIDIEGAEIPCLLGAMKTLKKYRPHIIIEVQKETFTAAGYSPEDIFNILEPLNYQLFILKNDGSTKRIGRRQLRNYQNLVAVPS